ncbi:agmatinase [Marinomonas epiphytica]
MNYSALSVLNVPLDFNSSHLRGPAQAPALIRDAIYNGSANTTAEMGINVGKNPKIHFAGDVRWDSESQAFEAIEKQADTLTKQGHKILTLGGDHSITYPLIKSLAKTYKKLNILHFDAHPDLYDVLLGNKHSHACPFARIMESKLATRLTQVGIRTLNDHQKSQANKFGVEVHEMKNWQTGKKLNLEGPLYISLDLDALDPAYAPGVSHHEPGGLSVREILTILQGIEVPVVGADIVEYNPTRDINGMTAMVCAKFYKEIAGLMLRDCVS